MSELGHLDLDEDDREDDEAFDGIDSEKRPNRYYRSEKALGVLYRNIDEGEFLRDMQKVRRDRMALASSSQGLLASFLHYVKHWTSQYVIMYEHHSQLAADIRAE